MSRPERRTRIVAEEALFRGSFRAMGSPCELLIASRDASLAQAMTDTAAAEAWRIEDKFSRYLPKNIVARINNSRGEPIEVDSETADLIDFAARLFELSGGRFDITSGALREVWTFDGSDRIPDRAAVERVRSVVGWDRARWQRPTLRLEPGMQIDLGGIGKEFAVDRAAALVGALSNAGCLLNFGGDLVARGALRKPDGWQVGIESIDAATGSRRIHLKSGALATSGDARRYLLKDGQRYGHILDPTTGWPVTGAPRSVTVAADTCTQAGMLATLAMLEGPNAEAFLDEQELRYWCLR